RRSAVMGMPLRFLDVNRDDALTRVLGGHHNEPGPARQQRWRRKNLWGSDALRSGAFVSECATCRHVVALTPDSAKGQPCSKCARTALHPQPATRPVTGTARARY